MSEEKEEILHLQDMYSLRHSHTPVTVVIHRWVHYIHRVALTIVEGYHKTSEDVQTALQAASRKEWPYLKSFTIICRPSDFLMLAEALRRVCTPSERPI